MRFVVRSKFMHAEANTKDVRECEEFGTCYCESDVAVTSRHVLHVVRP